MNRRKSEGRERVRKRRAAAKRRAWERVYDVPSAKQDTSYAPNTTATEVDSEQTDEVNR